MSDPLTSNRQADASAIPCGTLTLNIIELRNFLQKASTEDITVPFELSVSLAPTDSRSALLTAYGDDRWLDRVFNRSEDELVRIYSQNDASRSNPPPSVTVGTINLLFSEERDKEAWWASSSDTEHWPRVRIVAGLDALLLPCARAAADGFVQAASQFNALESTTAARSRLSSYPFDSTQGPRVVMPCAHALLRRHVSDLNAFSLLIPDRKIRNEFVKNGYVYWSKKPESFLKAISSSSSTENAIDELLVFLMWAHPELALDAGHELIQVFCAAPPINAYGNAGPAHVQTQIAKLLVVAQYRAIAQLAAIRSRIIGRPVPLHLTRVGGGVFNNPSSILKDAFAAVLEVLAGERVVVYMHAFGSGDLARTRSEAAAFANAPLLSSADFLDGKGTHVPVNK